jgi:hypothetical protein
MQLVWHEVKRAYLNTLFAPNDICLLEALALLVLIY